MARAIAAEPRRPTSRKEGIETSPIHDPSRRRTRRFHNGGSQIEVADRSGIVDSFEDPGSPDDEWHFHSLLVGQALSEVDPMLALVPAVVGRKDDERVVQLA